MKASFERARNALDFLERHLLEPSTAYYDFALQYISERGSALTHDVDEQTYGGVRLTPDAVRKLVQRHCPPPSGPTLDRRERAVARQADELGALASGAHDITAALGRDVGAAVKQSEMWPEGVGELAGRLTIAERELTELRGEFLALRYSISQSEAHKVDKDRDELTQALNQDGARQVLERAAERGSPYLLMMFSVDDLIGINGRFGRPVGDNVLNAFAATLQQVFKREELIRWTGNEFIIAATDLATAAARMLVDEALTALRARRLKLRGTGEWIGPVTASAGIVLSQGEIPEAALARARANVLLAAERGGNRFEG